MNEWSLSDNITRLRHEKKLTQEELADFCGVTKASVSKWEKGINTPDLLLLPRLAAYFDVTVDELIGYQPQLSTEQIRRHYAELSRDFTILPFAETVEKVRALAHKYYACYPLLLQLSVLYWNHCMLAETVENRQALLLEAAEWCDRILERCRDTGICSDATVLRAGLQIQLGNAAQAIEALEAAADPGRLAGQTGRLLAQAYQLAGDNEKARSYTQVKQYLDLLALTEDAILDLSLNKQDLRRCEEIIRRVNGITELYHLETLHPNVAAQFQFQSAVVYAVHEKSGEALNALGRFADCVERLLNECPVRLHGDDYFDALDVWIGRLPLEGMAPRDQSFILRTLPEALAHPAFERLRDRDAFQRIVRRFSQTPVNRSSEKGDVLHVKDRTLNQTL